MKTIQYIKFGLDVLMAATFVLFFNKQVFGGLTFHEIAGLVMAVIFFTHILLNWKWVKHVTFKLFDHQLQVKKKFSYLLNIMLLITMTFIIISGIFISRVVFPNIMIGNEQWFKLAHISVSYVVLVLVAAHIGLHWRWVINVCKHIIGIKTPNLALGILAKTAAIALFIFGSYQMYSTNFTMHLQGVARIFTFSSLQASEHNFEKGEKQHPLDAFKETPGTLPPKGLEERERLSHSDSSIIKDKRQIESPNALGVISTYLSIMSVFIVIIYYLDSWGMRKKRKKNKNSLTNTDIKNA